MITLNTLEAPVNNKSNKAWFCLVLSIALAIAGCGRTGNDQAADEEHESAEQSAPPTLTTLLAGESRAAADRARDDGRKPAEVIAFLGIEPGMNVVDIIGAGGYYTEVLSLAVGPRGHVTAQNPAIVMQLRDGINETQLSERLADNRLPNVTRLDKEMAELSAEDGPFDAAITALNLHDIYNGYGEDSAIETLQLIYATLKPGGVFGIIDHNGAAGNDNTALHRMLKEDAVRVAEAAGFVVEDDSGLLHVHHDDMTQVVFAEGIRGKTHRFLLKLRKPQI